MKKKVAIYYRVSTQKWSISDLDLDAQKKTVMNYLHGRRWTLLKEFIEDEPFKGSNAIGNRPVLKEAIAYAMQQKATLIIAKLDGLTRNVPFMKTILESKVPFKIADMPETDTITLAVMAALAEYEGKKNSERTREALAVKKAELAKVGKKLGNPNLKADNTARIQKADDFAASLRQTIQIYKNKGLSQREMVEELNNTGVKTPRGKSWHLLSLQRVIKRIG